MTGLAVPKVRRVRLHVAATVTVPGLAWSLVLGTQICPFKVDFVSKNWSRYPPLAMADQTAFSTVRCGLDLSPVFIRFHMLCLYIQFFYMFHICFLCNSYVGVS